MANIYGTSFDPQVIRDLKKLDEKIEEKKDEPLERAKLEMAKLLRGMELTSGYNKIYNGGIPY